MTDNPLLTEKIPKLYVAYVVPTIVSMVLDGMQPVIDGMFLGHFGKVYAMASVNIASPYYQVFVGCSMVVCAGAVSALGRAIGRNDITRARNIFRSSLVVLAAVTLTFAVIGVVAGGPLARAFGASERMAGSAARYLSVISVFMPIMAFRFYSQFIGRIIGKPNLILYGTIVSLVMNITFDIIIIGVMGMGAGGAALVTGLSNVIGFTVTGLPLLKRETILNVYEGKFSLREVRKFILNGSSEGVTYVANALTVFLINISFMRLVGDNGVIAFTTINYISNFVLLVMYGTCDGVSTIISNNYGAGNKGRIRQCMKLAVCSNFAIGLTVCLAFQFAGGALVSAFGNLSQAQIELGRTGAAIYGAAFLFNGINILISSYYTAIGSALKSSAIAACRGIVLIVIGVVVLVPILGVSGVWMTVPFAEGGTIAIFLLIRYIKKGG